MNLDDLKTYLEYARRVATILSRRIDPIGSEYDVLLDVVSEVKTLRFKERDVEVPGIKRAWDQGVIQGAVAYFRDKVKKDVMPVQFAKDDNLVIEPLYRPKIFGLTNFTVTWSGVTPPASVDLLNYNLQVDKELIILTDVVCIGDPSVVELQATVDGETQRPVTCRKDFQASDVKVYEFPFPLVADINIRLQGRVETASGTFTFLPIGVHVCLGSIHAKTLV